MSQSGEVWCVHYQKTNTPGKTVIKDENGLKGRGDSGDKDRA